MDFPVDIVYTWVDGSDKNWILKKQKQLKSEIVISNQAEEASGNCRFIDRDELKFSLRSVSTYMKWVRKIYIVTDNQIPNWLNLLNPKIEVIDHKDIIDNEFLPCFNSNVIEAFLYKIKGLSNNFISFNDDLFIGRPTQKTDFFYQNKPKLFVGKKQSTIFKHRLLNKNYLARINPHQMAIFNARKLVYEKTGTLINYNLRHGIKPLNKKAMKRINENYKIELQNSFNNKFRNDTDVWSISLEAFDSIANKLNTPFYLKPYRKNYLRYKIHIFRKKRDYVFISLGADEIRINQKLDAIKNFKPLMFCINDTPNVSEKKYLKINEFLSDFYSKKCEYEL